MTEQFKDFGEQGVFSAWMKYAIIFAVLFLIAAVAAVFVVERRGKSPPVKEGSGEPVARQAAHSAAATDEDLHTPVRPPPASFPIDSNLPQGKETLSSGPIDLATFKPDKDLIRFVDERVWFESDNKKDPEEDDHKIHRSMEVPLKRLVNLLEKKSGGKAKLKVHDAYRLTGVHLPGSLHKEGRAIDLTGDGISQSELAKLAWQAGFDFVLYEKPEKGRGEHLHCSVKRSPDAPLPERPKSGAASPAN